MRPKTGISHLPARYCSFCGQGVAAGEVYWYIDGGTICADCLPDYARADYGPFRHIHGEEKDFFETL